MKTVIICVPGKEWKRETAESIFKLTARLSKDWSVRMVTLYTADILKCRNSILGFPKKTDEHVPFMGCPYDYILWIDSDMVFDAYQFDMLYKRDVDIVSGTYKMADGRICAAVDFSPNGHHRFLIDKDIEGKKDLIVVDWCGLGFMLVKKGVFEEIGYPWFRQRLIKTQVFDDYSSEDAGFCLDAEEHGFTVYIDPMVRIGHIKEATII